MRAFVLANVLLIMAGGTSAQSASKFEGLESCFEAGHLTDVICSSVPNTQQSDCYEKARAAQLECLRHVLTGPSAGLVVPEPPAATSSPETPSGNLQSVLPRAVPPAPTTGTASTQEATESNLPKTSARTASPEKPIGNATANMVTGTVPPRPPSTMAPSQVPATVSRDQPARPAPPDLPSKTVDLPPKPPINNWVVSETTSPLDYSPLMTATIDAQSSEKDAPNILVIRCRQSHVELVLRTEGVWRVSLGREVQVGYQINEQSLVRLAWAASADGKTATYQDDAVGFLRSLPEGARLKIDVFDELGAGHAATFQLIGLDVVRKKIEVACKWQPPTAGLSSDKR